LNRLTSEAISARCQDLAANVQAFLAGRGLAADRLEAVARKQFPEAGQLLLTSSPVQGLATPTSDIDLIAILADPGPGGGMATQIYVDDNHAEVAVLARADFETACQALEALRDSPLGAAGAAMRGWDKTQPVKKKYLERAINGVAFDGDLPNAGLFDALVTVDPHLHRVHDLAEAFTQNLG